MRVEHYCVFLITNKSYMLKKKKGSESTWLLLLNFSSKKIYQNKSSTDWTNRKKNFYFGFNDERNAEPLNLNIREINVFSVLNSRINY